MLKLLSEYFTFALISHILENIYLHMPLVIYFINLTSCIETVTFERIISGIQTDTHILNIKLLKRKGIKQPQSK